MILQKRSASSVYKYQRFRKVTLFFAVGVSRRHRHWKLAIVTKHITIVTRKVNLGEFS